MVSPESQNDLNSALHKIEQLPHKFVHSGELPERALLLDSIKPLEIELQRRNLTQTLGTGLVHPLWFIAETERNVFLWRNGFSLSDEIYFEFWIDIDGLIQKRGKQLEAKGMDNPFMNTMWGGCDEASGSEDAEGAYLASLREALAPIILHAHSLGRVAAEVRREVLDCGMERPRILLPK